MELLLDQQQAYQEKQRAWIHARQVDTELWAAQRRDELASEQVALDTQLTELHQHKAELRVERATTIDLTKPQAWSRAVATTTPDLRHGQREHGHGSGALGQFACALHRRGGQCVPSTEGHPCHSC
jgi:hypothetical protein